MATESQFDKWRRNALNNLRKAGEAFKARGAESEVRESNLIEGMTPSDRAELCLGFAQTTSNLMISERLGQLVSMMTMSGDDRLAAQAERIRTGEQVLQRIVDTAENSDLSVEDELMVSVTMAEDWLDPESMVNFASPESVEKGTDAQSKEFADPDEETEDQFDRAEEDMKDEE